jgi:hypothetical protein
VEGTGSESSPMADFGSSSIERLCLASTVLVKDTSFKASHFCHSHLPMANFTAMNKAPVINSCQYKYKSNGEERQQQNVTYISISIISRINFLHTPIAD